MSISQRRLMAIGGAALLLEVISKSFLHLPTGVAGHVCRLALAGISVPAYALLFYLSGRETRRRRAERTGS